MRTIYKFPLAGADGLPLDEFFLDMPAGARLLAVQLQLCRPWLWALVDPDAADERRRFITAGTGHPLPEAPLDYVGTYQLSGEEFGGRAVFHVFELGEGAARPRTGRRPSRRGGARRGEA